MLEKTIVQKLLIKARNKVFFINPPENYLQIIGDIPENVTILPELTESADVIQVFIKDKTELEAQLTGLKSIVKPGSILWVTYYKGTSKMKTDIHRGSINAYARTLGLEGGAMISIDQDWSALRLKVSK